ncbi:hypothetical protein [Deminuibacter soli]|uniref:Uncharacterized protein n=1 Tax=Deminuibacter soli TaxID=2291815 RepID=A0A3E1NJ53_9BACT|nr:hypothetical protein [Deminuibacter soli]RFM27967.1 hypothetical protein DXN05_10505 [Deminuibacter soli]
MNNVSRLLGLILLFVCSYEIAGAQSVKGKWYGAGNVDGSNSSNNYLFEFILDQKGSVVTGELNYYFRNGYFSNKIKGTYNATSRKLHIQFIPIMFYQTVNTALGVDCKMEGDFILKVSRAETTLQGSFTADDFYKNTAPPINIKFTKLLKEVPFKTIVEEEIAKQDSVNLKPIESPVAKLQREATLQLNMRTKDLVKELDVTEDSVRIDLYDNGDFDHDSVSIFYNNALVEYKKELDTRKPITFKVHVDDIATNNDLVMFAENLGLIPPNSALMIITDKNHRYEVNLTSNYQKNAAVRLKKTAPPQKK